VYHWFDGLFCWCLCFVLEEVEVEKVKDVVTRADVGMTSQKKDK
jgi:hypothetical protein